MTLRSRRPTRAYARRARIVLLCMVAISMLAMPAFCETISSSVAVSSRNMGSIGWGAFNAWRWGGCSSSSAMLTNRFVAAPTSWTNVDLTADPADAISTDAADAFTAPVEESAPATSITPESAMLTAVPTGSVGGSLSGYVYLDSNQNHEMDSTDWAIAEAKVSLLLENSSALALIEYTDKYGAYSFTGLNAGSYTISMITPSEAGQDAGTWRTMYDKDDVVVSVGTNGTVDVNSYSNVDLLAGYSGDSYNFAEATYPTSLISKRLLMGPEPGVPHTPDVVKPVPEPSAFVLLAIAAVCLGGFVRRFRSAS